MLVVRGSVLACQYRARPECYTDACRYRACASPCRCRYSPAVPCQGVHWCAMTHEWRAQVVPEVLRWRAVSVFVPVPMPKPLSVLVLRCGVQCCCSRACNNACARARVRTGTCAHGQSHTGAAPSGVPATGVACRHWCMCPHLLSCHMCACLFPYLCLCRARACSAVTVPCSLGTWSLLACSAVQCCAVVCQWHAGCVPIACQ